MIDLKGCKIVRSATAEELEGLTSSGWIFLGYVTVSEPMAAYDTDHVVVPPAPVPAGCYSPPGEVRQVMNARGVLGQRAVFLLGRDEDSALGKLRAELDTERARYKEWDDKLQAERKAHGETKEAHERCRSVLLSEEAGTKRRDQEIHTMRETKSKLETDIGKLRKEIGEGRFREIVAPEQPSEERTK